LLHLLPACAAFSGYLGEDKEAWAEYDATALLMSYTGPKLPVLVDTGLADNFYKVWTYEREIKHAEVATRHVMTITE
jgi:S-formylglutathione hydrolase